MQLVRSRREWPFAVVVLEVVAMLMSFFVDGRCLAFVDDARLVKTVRFYTICSDNIDFIDYTILYLLYLQYIY